MHTLLHSKLNFCHAQIIYNLILLAEANSLILTDFKVDVMEKCSKIEVRRIFDFICIFLNKYFFKNAFN